MYRPKPQRPVRAPRAHWRGRRRIAGGVLLACLLGGCAGTQGSAARRDFVAAPRPRAGEVATAPPAPAAPTAESPAQAERVGAGPVGLGGYVAWALAHSPAVRAAHARWEAQVLRISRAHRLPEPVVGFGVFVRAVETRVGPQRAKLGVQQAIPWLGKLSAASDAAAAQARASQAVLDARMLEVGAQVQQGYWKLWELRHTRAIHREHLEVIRGLSETVRARIATGAASLADQQQVDLTAARLQDGIDSMDEAERAAAARLRAVIGLPSGQALPTPAAPPALAMPRAELAALEALLGAHPSLGALEHAARAHDARARAEGAEGLPDFTVGADWILTGEVAVPGAPERGKDAVMASVGVRVPLWQGSYDDAAAAARADALALRAQRQAAVDQATAELHSAHAAARDTARRAQLYAETLLPQADSSYASVLGAYTTGRGTVAQTLLAQRDLLELRVELARARAAHANAWARLQHVVGRALTPVPYARPTAGVQAQSLPVVPAQAAAAGTARALGVQP